MTDQPAAASLRRISPGSDAAQVAPAATVGDGLALHRAGRLDAGAPGISFVSLQKGEAAAQTRSPPRGIIIHDWTDELDDFADTAALIEALDLVISVDTAVAHMAGALGKPVWLLNRFDTCWRWLLDRTDSPWYPTLRQFRQPGQGDWETVLANIRLALLEMAAGSASAADDC